MKTTVRFTLNGRPYKLDVEPHEALLDVLRRDCGQRSVRETCAIGICGACTVLVDGEMLSACLLLAPQVDGCEIETVEGETLDEVQRAFVDCTAFQCSYCTPGMILATRALLAENAAPTVEEIRHYLAGNLCRCGSYLKIIQAVQLAAKRRNAD
ncbi:MAG: (2Fe-2S)-binding protein [Ardenticatenaceae bacterium]|nr:(2Fe-2S)-binding protein [Ardenticatenaceae bacterium]